MSPLPIVPHKNLPTRPYDRTDAESAAIAKAEVAAHFEKKKPEPAPVYTEKQKAYALDFLNIKSQYQLHHKPDDYLHTVDKKVTKSKSIKSTNGRKLASKSASRSKSSKTASGKKSYVSQLGQ